jgi:hypothetical protein
MKKVSATIQIAAPPMEVWAVLVDLRRYPKWNPLFPQASGQIAVGNRITLGSVTPTGHPRSVRPRILIVEPGVELRWRASIPGIIGGEHSFVLSPADQGTQLVQSETFRGILVPFAGAILARSEASYQKVNQALKKRVETGRRR